jgi:hypothetical protein
MGSSRHILLASVLLAITSGASAADAGAPGITATERETARALMDDGYAKDERGDHAGALKSFLAADALMHVPTTTLQVAREQVALGQLVEARVTLLPILLSNAVAGEPPVFTTARQQAQATYDALSPRIPSLRVTVNGAIDLASATLRIDSLSLPASTIGVPLRVNPGHHRVSITDKAGNEAERETDVAEGAAKDVTLTVVGPPASASAPPAGGLPESESPEAPGGAARKNPAQAWLRWGGVVLAVAGAGVGAATGIVSLSSGSSAKGLCSGSACPPAAWGDLNQARTMATVSDIAFAAGGAGLVAFVASFAFSSPSAPPNKAGASVDVWFGGRVAGVSGKF